MKESLQIEIPTPCREDWERMVKGDEGRHCNLCQKTVDMRGRLVAERLVEVGGAGQVDQWVMPVGLAAGVYVLRITERSEVLREGGRRVDVREVMVR